MESLRQRISALALVGVRTGTADGVANLRHHLCRSRYSRPIGRSARLAIAFTLESALIASVYSLLRSPAQLDLNDQTLPSHLSSSHDGLLWLRAGNWTGRCTGDILRS